MVKLLKCAHCGNMAKMIEDKGPALVCCGEPMKVFKANTTDAAVEKHVPAVKLEGNKVTVHVGEVTHPMTEEHHIAFIMLETSQGIQEKYLDHTGEPEAVFMLAEGETPVAAYEYCNLHGFWKKEF